MGAPVTRGPCGVYFGRSYLGSTHFQRQAPTRSCKISSFRLTASQNSGKSLASIEGLPSLRRRQCMCMRARSRRRRLSPQPPAFIPPIKSVHFCPFFLSLCTSQQPLPGTRLNETAATSRKGWSLVELDRSLSNGLRRCCLSVCLYLPPSSRI